MGWLPHVPALSCSHAATAALRRQAMRPISEEAPELLETLVTLTFAVTPR